MKSVVFIMQHPPLLQPIQPMQSDANNGNGNGNGNNTNNGTVRAEIHELMTACLTDEQKKKYAEFLANQAVATVAAPLLSVDNWKHTKAFTNNKRRETQTQYYVRMAAATEVIEMVSLDSKPFGTVGEQILAELFQMAPRTSTQNDGVFEGRKCEIKCARHWAGKDDSRWQHLEPDHDYEFAMLALLDFHEWKVWCISKAQLMGELRDKKVVTFQGKQGWWTLKSAIMPYLTPIHGLECLRKFVSALPK
jgi:hypothetical protein